MFGLHRSSYNPGFCFFFVFLMNTVIHSPRLVESVAVEPQIGKANYWSWSSSILVSARVQETKGWLYIANQTTLYFLSWVLFSLWVPRWNTQSEFSINVFLSRFSSLHRLINWHSEGNISFLWVLLTYRSQRG